jgi:hypothetical protein
VAASAQQWCPMTVSGGGGSGVLIGSAEELCGSLLWLGVEEDEVRRVSSQLSMARGAERLTVVCCGAAPVVSSEVDVVS